MNVVVVDPKLLLVQKKLLKRMMLLSLLASVQAQHLGLMISILKSMTGVVFKQRVIWR